MRGTSYPPHKVHERECCLLVLNNKNNNDTVTSTPQWIRDSCDCRPHSSIRTLVVSAHGGGGAVGAWSCRGATRSELKTSSLARASTGIDP